MLPGRRDGTSTAEMVQTVRVGRPGQVLALVVQAEIAAPAGGTTAGASLLASSARVRSARRQAVEAGP